MQTHEALAVAVGGSAKSVREALCALGKRVSLRWVYYLCEPSADVRRLNPYAAFLLLFEAVWRVNREGAEFLYEDFRARVASLREAAAPAAPCDWYEQLSELAREQGEALSAAIAGHDDKAIRRELTQSIAAERQLLRMLDARASASAGLAA